MRFGDRLSARVARAQHEHTEDSAASESSGGVLSAHPEPAADTLVELKAAVRAEGERIVRRLEKRERRGRLEVGRLDYEAAEICLRLESRASVSRLNACTKEPWTVAWIERSLTAGGVFYDVGANVGAYALVAASTRRPDRVVALEPAYGSFALLCENVILNGLDETVVPLPVALGSSTRLGTFNYRDLDAGAAMHSLTDDDAARAASIASRC